MLVPLTDTERGGKGIGWVFMESLGNIDAHAEVPHLFWPQPCQARRQLFSESSQNFVEDATWVDISLYFRPDFVDILRKTCVPRWKIHLPPPLTHIHTQTRARALAPFSAWLDYMFQTQPSWVIDQRCQLAFPVSVISCSQNETDWLFYIVHVEVIHVSGSMFPLQAEIRRVITFQFLIPFSWCRKRLEIMKKELDRTPMNDSRDCWTTLTDACSGDGNHTWHVG